MNVIRAEVLGMCFGVRDALAIIAGVPRPADVAIHGHLVHNDVVTTGLEARGFATTQEADRGGVPSRPVVLITAHGVSGRERSRLEAAGKTLVDTTCPLVARAHDAALKLARAGYHVIVVGRRGHVEVLGITGDLESFDVVETPEEVVAYSSRKLGVVCQTTTPERLAARVRAAVVAKNPEAEVKYIDTVCHPTKEHQRSLDRLLDRVEAVVVVGGKTSNNTRELVALCEDRGKKACHVATAADLVDEWFDGLSTVGLTAGTSTLDETIDDVERAIRRLPVSAFAGAD